MFLEARRDGLLAFGYLDPDSPTPQQATDSVLIRSEGPYTSEIRHERFGALHACDIVGGSPVRVSPYMPMRGRTASLALGLLLSDDASLEQDGRRCDLRPGDFVMYSAMRPFRLDVGSGYRWFVVDLASGPADIHWLVRNATANHGISRRPCGQILGAMLAGLADHAAALGPVSRREMGEHVIALIRTVVHEAKLVPPPSGHADLLDRILSYIDRHLTETPPPAKIADVHHISVRFLHKLFRGHGLTVSDHVRRRRLERVRQDLANPALAHLPAYVVAGRWGFHEASHFSKLFKAEFGVSPRAFRAERHRW